MRKAWDWVASYFDSWDEICTSEQARLRTNNILLYFAIALISFAMTVVNLVTQTYNLLAVTVSLFAIFTIMLFLILSRRRLQNCCAAVTILCGILVPIYFLYSGGIQGFSPMWLCMMPSLSYLVHGRAWARAYNMILICIVAVALWTPVRGLLEYEYTVAFASRFPVMILFANLCAWLSEVVRAQTRMRLVATTKTLEECALTDALTGIGNRHSFYQDLQKRPNAGSLCYAVVDIDFFKRVNDAHGHTMGDEVLRLLAHTIRSNLRPLDKVYRWGGEEFLIVLPRLDFCDFERSLVRLCERVQASELRLSCGVSVNVTISIGGVMGSPHMESEQCIAEADKNLYVAKQTGRNRVVATNHAPNHPAHEEK